MSKAKKTKRAKEYSQQNLYRHIDNLLRHAKNKESRMSDQRTAATVLVQLAVKASVTTDGYDEPVFTAAQALYDDLLARLQALETHGYSCNVGDNKKRYDVYLDDVEAILRAYFLAGEDGAV
jgi:short subunit dehydrogenase-like uncharacterized protein